VTDEKTYNSAQNNLFIAESTRVIYHWIARKQRKFYHIFIHDLLHDCSNFITSHTVAIYWQYIKATRSLHTQSLPLLLLKVFRNY